MLVIMHRMKFGENGFAHEPSLVLEGNPTHGFRLHIIIVKISNTWKVRYRDIVMVL